MLDVTDSSSRCDLCETRLEEGQRCDGCRSQLDAYHKETTVLLALEEAREEVAKALAALGRVTSRRLLRRLDRAERDVKALAKRARGGAA